MDADELSDNFKSIAWNTNVGWPGQIIRFLQKKISLEDLVAHAKTSPFEMDLRICAVNFFSGMLSNHEGNSDDARRQLLAAADECPAGAAEKDFAKLELRRLGLARR